MYYTTAALFSLVALNGHPIALIPASFWIVAGIVSSILDRNRGDEQ